MDFVAKWSTKTELPAKRFVAWLGIARGKFYQWKQHYGRAHEHNGQVPRDHWIEPWERSAIIDYFDAHPLDGYRRLSFMMLDDDVVAVSPSTTFRVLRATGRLDRFNGQSSKKGTGFVQPFGPHQHWHIDVSYLNLAGISSTRSSSPTDTNHASSVTPRVASGIDCERATRITK